MASTGFGVLITGDSKGAVKAIDLTSDQIKELEATTAKATKKIKSDTKSMDDGFGGISKSALKMGKDVALAGVALAGLVLAKFIKETSESENAIALLNNALAATGGAAGKSAQELIKTANSMQNVTTYSDEAVLGMETLLLKFKNIKGDNFDRTTQAVLDMSAALKKDLPAAAQIVGRALDNPIKGMAALAKAGVTLTDSQKETVKALVETGDTAGAQSLLLEQLEGRFKGAAEAAGNTLPGALAQLGNHFGDLFEATSTSSAGMVASIKSIDKTISAPEFQAAIQTLIKGLIDLTNVAAKAVQGFSEFGVSIGETLAKAVSGIATDDTAGLQKSIAGVTLQLDMLAKGGETSGRVVDDLKAQLAGLEGQLKVNQTLTAKTGQSVAGYAKSLVTGAVATEKFAVVTAKGGASTEKFSLIVNKSSVAVDKAAGSTKKYSDLNLVSSTTQAKSAAAADKLAASHKKVADQLEKAQKSIADTSRELTGMNKKTEDYIASLKFETVQVGLSERAQFINNKVREAGTAITAAQTEEIKLAAAALYDQTAAADATTKANEDAAQATSAAWADARATLSNFFFEMARDGKGAFDTLIDGFKAMLSKMAAEAAANTIFVAVGLGQASGVSAAGTAATSGGSSLLSGGVSSLSGGVTGLAAKITAGGAGLYSGLGTALNDAGMFKLSNAFNAKAASTSIGSIGADIGGGLAGGYLGSKVFGETSGIGATVGGIAGSALIPIPGLGAAIGSFIGTGLEKAAQKVFGQKNDGNNRGAANFNLSTGSIDAAGVGKSFSQESVDAAKSLAEQVKAFSDSIGGSNLAANITVSGKDGIQFGGQSFGTDSAAFFKKAFKDVIEASTNLDVKLKPLILDFDGSAEEIAQFATTLTALDERAGGLKDTLLTLIGNFEGTAQETLRFADAIVGIDLQTGINAVSDAVKDFNVISDTAFTSYGRTTDALQDAIYKFDGSATAAENLNVALAANKTAAYQFASAIQAIGKKISEIAAQQANDIRESVLSAAELQKKRTAERDALRKSLDTLIDPADIEKTSEQILALNKQIFDGLSDEAKKSSVDAFAGYAEETATATAGLLDKKLKELGTAETDINTAISNLLRDSAAKQLDAANIQLTAANIIAEAARTLSKAPAPTRPTTTTAPVADVYSEVA